MARSQISLPLRDDVAVSRTETNLSQEEFASRRTLGGRICAEFSFDEVNGRTQVARCMKGLMTLADKVSCIVMRLLRTRAAKTKPRQLDADIPEPVGVPRQPAGIGDLDVQVDHVSEPRVVQHIDRALVLKGSRSLLAVRSATSWALPMAGRVPRDSVPPPCVFRRDRWIGWYDGGRGDHLHRVIYPSRFVIGSTVRCGTWQAVSLAEFCAGRNGTAGRATVTVRFSSRAHLPGAKTRCSGTR